MKHQRLLLPIVASILALAFGCNTVQPPEPQFVKIKFQYDYRDMVDTFNDTLMKDLVSDGTITVSFWLTKTEQEAVLAELSRADFFNLPDTIRPTIAVNMRPDPSPDSLHVQVEGREKTVVWLFPLDDADHNAQMILQLSKAIQTIIESTDQYKRLPQARGAYI